MSAVPEESAEGKLSRMLSGLIPGKGTEANQAEAEVHHRTWLGLFRHYRSELPYAPLDVIVATVLRELYDRKVFRGKAPNQRMPGFQQVKRVIEREGLS